MPSTPARTEHEHVRVSADERLAVRAAATRQGVSTSTFIRNATARAARAVLKQTEDGGLVVGLVLAPEEAERLDRLARSQSLTRADAIRRLIADAPDNPFMSAFVGPSR
ncbi:hypothetical protein GKE82_07525 [Conexibacter sp. W3-3-2]|uniref:hypothetical protein n=1 Tax=Conexibacter sp. W3-3-2 TaxID=2675227 RepID=UPI0012B86A8E|nr:hypothetical protein [Conexibacter sp. W3-3-2]MTD44153.1 hypothetical protein [Conexibacter sp. W3-3-2]